MEILDIKFRFIKKIIIGSTLFEVKWDKTRNGADFNYPYKDEAAKITIGIRDLESNPLRTLEVLIHELIEIIHIELNTRFTRLDCDTAYEFHYTHRQHHTACSMLPSLLVRLSKINRPNSFPFPICASAQKTSSAYSSSSSR